jgi:hypothetical protein
METLAELGEKCGLEMMLVGSEDHTERPGTIFHTYECRNGHVTVVEEPKNGKDSHTINGIE